MADGDRSRDQHPDNLVFWRLSACEEALKHMSSQVEELRNRQDRAPSLLAREFPTKLEVDRTYVRKDDMQQSAATGRDIWTLRLAAIGILSSNIIAVIGLLHHS